MISEFEFLRPLALWLLLLLPPLFLALRRQGVSRSPWQNHFDPELFQALTRGDARAGRPAATPWLVVVGAALAVLALAGPSWRMVEVPTQPPRAEAVIVLGLAPSMMATDLSPDRLTRARIALGEWLDANPEQLTGLVTFAASAFRVSPLTQDRETIKHLLGSLQPDVLPRAGADIAAGLRLGRSLLSTAPGPKHLLLVTDAPVTPDSTAVAAELSKYGIGLWVLGVGTAEGAPIPLSNGRFATTGDGRLMMARVDHAPYRELARAGGGSWQRSTGFDALRWISSPPGGLQASSTASERGTRIRQDDGAWLLLLLLPLAAGLFRRGALLLVLVIVTPLPGPATAAALPDWLLNEGQRSVRAYRAQPDEQTAAALPAGEWRGYGAFEQGDFEAAADAFAELPGLRAQYNHALSLAHQGLIDEAIAGFSALLEQHPDHADARHNLEVLQKARDAQQQQQQQGDDVSAEAGQQAAADEAQQQSEAGEGQNPSEPAESAQDAASESSPGGQEQQEAQEQTASQSEAETQDAQQARQEPGTPDAEAADQAQQASLTASDTEQADSEERAVLQWLNRVESDPGRLLRERFRSQDARRRRENRQ